MTRLGACVPMWKKEAGTVGTKRKPIKSRVSFSTFDSVGRYANPCPTCGIQSVRADGLSFVAFDWLALHPTHSPPAASPVRRRANPDSGATRYSSTVLAALRIYFSGSAVAGKRGSGCWPRNSWVNDKKKNMVKKFWGHDDWRLVKVKSMWCKNHT